MPIDWPDEPDAAPRDEDVHDFLDPTSGDFPTFSSGGHDDDAPPRGIQVRLHRGRPRWQMLAGAGLAALLVLVLATRIFGGSDDTPGSSGSTVNSTDTTSTPDETDGTDAPSSTTVVATTAPTTAPTTTTAPTAPQALVPLPAPVRVFDGLLVANMPVEVAATEPGATSVFAIVTAVNPVPGAVIRAWIGGAERIPDLPVAVFGATTSDSKLVVIAVDASGHFSLSSSLDAPVSIDIVAVTR